jgi:hypothetical protein
MTQTNILLFFLFFEANHLKIMLGLQEFLRVISRETTRELLNIDYIDFFFFMYIKKEGFELCSWY